MQYPEEIDRQHQAVVRAYLSTIGKKGGKSRSDKKRQASARNAAKASAAAVKASEVRRKAKETRKAASSRIPTAES